MASPLMLVVNVIISKPVNTLFLPYSPDLGSCYSYCLRCDMDYMVT
jgi:hypothetical protein